MKNLKKLMMILIGIVFIIYSIAFTVLYNLNIFAISYAIVGVILILLSILGDKRVSKPIKVILIAIRIIIIYIGATFIIMCIFISTNINYLQKGQYNAMIVLGTTGDDEINRLETTYKYWINHKNTLIVVSGKKDNNAIRSEAESMYLRLAAMGVPKDKIVMEEVARSTKENIEFSKKILDSKFPNGYNVLIVTNDFHSGRATVYAKSYGLNFKVLSSHTKIMSLPKSYAKEYLGYYKFVMFLLGNKH